ncbi:MAG: right-handed parallel beta-helix repeat-containing protein [Sedimentisphaerales bacterium]
MKFSVVVFSLTIFTFSVSAEIIYVDANGTGDYPTIQSAIDASQIGDQIILLPGIYTGTGNRDIDFLGKAIIVQSINPADPNIVAATIIDCNGTETEKHRGFNFHSNETENSILDGVTIINGTTEDSPFNGGGAIVCRYSSIPTIKNCILTNNTTGEWQGGGGIYCHAANPHIFRCTITNNTCGHSEGGGIYCLASNPIIESCVISKNSRGGIHCGGSSGSSPTIQNCLIVRNSGVGIQCDNVSNPKIINSTIYGNWGYSSGAIYSYAGCYIQIENSIIYGNYAYNWTTGKYDKLKQIQISDDQIKIDNSNIQGGKGGISNYMNEGEIIWGDGNIDTDPCFVDPCNGDYHLKSEGWRWDTDTNQWTWDNVTSRCIDAGNPGYSLGDEPTTLSVDPLHRFGVNKRIDMGAYGGTAEASMPPYGWALLSDIDNSGKVDFADFFYLVNYYLQEGENLNSDLNRDGAVNLEDLSLIALDWLKFTDWAED